jgi:hypothetical protein
LFCAHSLQKSGDIDKAFIRRRDPFVSMNDSTSAGQLKHTSIQKKKQKKEKIDKYTKPRVEHKGQKGEAPKQRQASGYGGRFRIVSNLVRILQEWRTNLKLKHKQLTTRFLELLLK